MEGTEMKLPEGDIANLRNYIIDDPGNVCDYAEWANVELYRLQGIINDLRADLDLRDALITQIQAMFRVYGHSVGDRQPGEARFTDPNDWERTDRCDRY